MSELLVSTRVDHFYNKFAKFYSFSIPQSEHKERGERLRIIKDKFFQEFSSSPSTHKALDLGCGEGLYALDFANYGYQTTGIDGSSEMIETCRNAAYKEGLSINLVCDDWMSALKKFKDEFHIVICVGNSLHHNSIDYLDELFPLVYSAMKPGGIFLMNCRNYERELGLIDVTDQGKSNLIEIFEEEDISSYGRKRVLKYMHRNIILDNTLTKSYFYTYNNFRSDRRTFNVHCQEFDLCGKANSLTTISTDVYYIFKDQIMDMLTKTGFQAEDVSNKKDEKTGKLKKNLASSKSWYVKGMKSV